MSEKSEVDLTGAKQNTGVWLVKVPKYLSQQWAKAAGRGEVGKLRIGKNQGKAEVSFTLNEDLTVIDGIDKTVRAPRDHPFTMQSVGGQTLAVFTESSSEQPRGQFSTDCELVGAERLSFVCQEFSLASAGICLCVVVWLNVCVRERGLQKFHEWKMDALVCMGHCLNTGGEQSLNPGVMVLTIRPPHPPLPLPPPHTPSFPVGQLEERSDGSSSVAGAGAGPDKIALEGVVVQRAECRPAVSENYMRLKRMQIEVSTKPVRLSQQLDKAVTNNYKPVANHSYNLEYDRKKKEDGKRARADKQQVLDILFSAFEKHQYYNIKDLVDITKQPVIYLKEILRDIGIYNVKGTHKNTWELRPEYRHYQGEEKTDE